VISVDTKKKELIGCFKNPGTVWAKVATPTNDHDFRSDASHIAAPTESSTRSPIVAMFSSASRTTLRVLPPTASRAGGRRWPLALPEADRMLILADTGGSNGSRCRAWKHGLMTKLCRASGLNVTVCHYPPGASKWNPIEHRLFSRYPRLGWRAFDHAGENAQLHPHHEDRDGLRVRATLVKATTRRASSQQREMATLSIVPHDVLPTGTTPRVVAKM